VPGRASLRFADISILSSDGGRQTGKIPDLGLECVIFEASAAVERRLIGD
jgi:hypothetical protein